MKCRFVGFFYFSPPPPKEPAFFGRFLLFCIENAPNGEKPALWGLNFLLFGDFLRLFFLFIFFLSFVAVCIVNYANNRSFHSLLFFNLLAFLWIGAWNIFFGEILSLYKSAPMGPFGARSTDFSGEPLKCANSLRAPIGGRRPPICLLFCRRYCGCATIVHIYAAHIC